MSNKPGNFGGFHIIDIDDTIEIQSELLYNDIKDSEVNPIMESSTDHGDPVRIFIFNGVGGKSILFEIRIQFQGRIESHYHIPPDSFKIYKDMYPDVVSNSEPL